MSQLLLNGCHKAIILDTKLVAGYEKFAFMAVLTTFEAEIEIRFPF